MTATVKAYIALGVLVALIISHIGAFFYGQHVRGLSCEVASTKTELHSTQATLQVNTAMQSAAAAVDTASAQRHTEVVTKFVPIDREVTKYVEKPVAAATCLDDDGLRAWNDANRGATESAPAASGGHAALPGTAASGIGESRGSAEQSRGSGEALSRMQGTPAGAGGSRPGSATGNDNS